MTSSIHLQMHGDHTHWLSETALWRDDIELWVKEIDEATREIDRIRESLRTHADALRNHAAAIGLHERQFHTHERGLAEYEKGAEGDELIGMAKTHQQESSQQTATRKVHERVKKFHYGLLAQFKLLLSAIAGPM